MMDVCGELANDERFSNAFASALRAILTEGTVAVLTRYLEG